MTSTAVTRLAIISFIVIAGLTVSWMVSIQAQEIPSILTCYDGGGRIVAEVPIPPPPDFRVQMGPVTQAHWTQSDGRQVVLLTSAPCVYLIRQPPAGSTGADG
jgi:hypothetical protein